MCRKCVDAVHKHLPKIAEKDIMDLLFGATCFPFGDAGQVEEQVKELAERTDGTFNGALTWATAKMTKAMEDIERPGGHI